MRPRPTRWFELLVARDDTTLALEALAATGAVELETRHAEPLPEGYAGLGPAMTRLQELATRYREFWPRDGLHPSSMPEAPARTLQRCIDCVQAWAPEAEPQVRQLQQSRSAQEATRDWLAVNEALAGGRIDLGLAARCEPPLQVRLAVWPGAAGDAVELAAAADAGPLLRPVPGEDAQRVLVVGTGEQLQALSQQVTALKGRMLPPPDWLAGDPGHDRREGAAHLTALAAAEAQARQALDALAERHGLRTALADVQRLQWVLDNVRGLESGALLCWITGWTAADSDAPLVQAVERSGARALLRLAPPPAGKSAPLLLSNPWWARPFEVFTRALGMPGGSEADPSPLLALAVPMLFGYMFGDVGQGLVIAAAGLALRRRFAIARLFIAGGLSAAAFGLLFGSVFGLHALTPLWLSPLQDPLATLAVPLLGGAALLSLGLGLTAVEAAWRGQGLRWLSTEAGFVLCYLALLAALRWPAALALAAFGAVAACTGHAVVERRASALGAALGELVERLMQILIHTLSFARVGAFALAHAGLSSALVALAEAAGHPVASLAVLVVGNLVVILLEGLVVSIQTTRLILFEFFARFLQGTGRVFRPLPLPPSALQES